MPTGNIQFLHVMFHTSVKLAAYSLSAADSPKKVFFQQIFLKKVRVSSIFTFSGKFVEKKLSPNYG